MSGIAGIIHFDGAPVAPGQVEKLTAAMAYRGPDGIRHWVQGSVALGQCMLCTTSESLEESQPLTSEDESLVLVMDGRVDNWEELRRELLGSGAQLRDRSDAELVLRAYQTWGRECLQRIDGDFALLIWDARRQEAFCARDRMGNKPFNYYWNGNSLVFASELHAILALPWVPQKLNEGMLAEYLAAEWHSRDETPWLGIRRLVAAHSLVVTREGIQSQRYWQPRLDTPLDYRDDEDYFEHYRTLLADSVRRLSRSHRPIACEVSGGLDSSAVFCMAARLRRSDRLGAPGLEGYTLAFHGDDPANEMAYARAAGEHAGLPIHEIAPTLPPLEWYANQARENRDFPGYPNGVMSAGLIRAAQARGSRVILNGVGGDEWLGGSHEYYAEELSQRRWGLLWKCYRADARAAGIRQASARLLRHGVLAALPAPLKASLRAMAARGRAKQADEHYWLTPRLRELIRGRRDLSSKPPADTTLPAGQRSVLGLLNQNSYRDLAIEETERLSAAQGIEVRSPLNTAAIVQFAVSLPARMRSRGSRNKFIHVGALHGYMPQAILERADKAEFGLVFRQPLDAIGDRFVEELAGRHPGWVSREGVARLVNFYQTDPLSGWPIWHLWGLFGCDSVTADTKSSPVGHAGRVASTNDEVNLPGEAANDGR